MIGHRLLYFLKYFFFTDVHKLAEQKAFSCWDLSCHLILYSSIDCNIIFFPNLPLMKKERLIHTRVHAYKYHKAPPYS